MSILIRGMDMPGSCAQCYFKYVAFNGIVKCDLAGHDFRDYKETGYRNDFPLVEVSPLWRMIDAGELYNSLDQDFTAFLKENRHDISQAFEFGYYRGIETAKRCFTNAPTIIEAEEEEDG